MLGSAVTSQALLSAASSSALPSRGHWPANRASCSPMNPPVTWIR
jgi:hypothetical protein